MDQEAFQPKTITYPIVNEEYLLELVLLNLLHNLFTPPPAILTPETDLSSRLGRQVDRP
jgi:hypothetical protein